MRVLHVIPAVGPYYGGPSVAIKGMTRGLARLGVDVAVVTTDANGPRPLDKPTGVALAEVGVTYRYFARTLPGEWKFSIPLTRWLFSHLREYDLVHVHAAFSFSTIPSCRFAAKARVPYVLRPLGTLNAWSLSQHRWKKRPYLALIERHHLRHAAAIHATSEAEAVAIRALGYGDRVRVVPLGVTLDPDGGRARPTRADGFTRLLFLSRLHPKKGIPLLFEALALIESAARDRLVLTIAGDGPAEYVNALRRLAADRGLADRVRFVGHVDGSVKQSLLLDSDAFILPSSDENFGIAVAEAMAAGLPVIISEEVAVAAAVKEAGAGVVVPLTAGALAGAIEAFALDRESRVRAGERAWRLAREVYSWESTSRSLLAMYDELVVARTLNRAADSRAVAAQADD